MENEILKVDAEAIRLVQGSITFNDYERIKEEAEALAEQIKTVEVNDESIKHSKKLLAVVNKRLKELDDSRIAIKKTMLEPYQLFEDQVKEIVGIVKEADTVVREQVKELEEKERLQKEEEIKTIWDMRIKNYSFEPLLPFSAFLKPNHLNKTASVNAVEKEMIEFLEQVEKDITVIETMEHSNKIIGAYLEELDLAGAISLVTAQLAKEKEIEKKAKALEKASAKEEKLSIWIELFDEKDFKLVEMFMKQNEIKFNVKEDK